MDNFDGMEPQRKVLKLDADGLMSPEVEQDERQLKVKNSGLESAVMDRRALHEELEESKDLMTSSQLRIKSPASNGLKIKQTTSEELDSSASHNATTVDLQRAPAPPQPRANRAPSPSHPPRTDRQRQVLNHQLNDKKLFMNSPESMSVTADGRSRQEILSSIDETQLLSTQVMNRAKGLIKIAVPKFLETIFIQSFLYDFMIRYREISVELLRYSGYAEDLHKEADITIFVGAHEEYEQQKTFVGEVEMGLFASPDLFEGKSVPNHPNQLAALKTLSMHSRSTDKWTFQDGVRHVHIKPPSSLIFKNFDVILEMLIDGLGIAMLPKVLCEPYEEEELVMEILSDFPPLTAEVLAYTKPSADLPLHVRTFVDYLNKKYMREAK